MGEKKRNDAQHHVLQKLPLVIFVEQTEQTVAPDMKETVNVVNKTKQNIHNESEETGGAKKIIKKKKKEREREREFFENNRGTPNEGDTL
jgi:hypothetical protein